MTIEVDLSTDTVANLKAKIRDKEGIEGEFQISLNGANLEDDNTLEACGVQSDNTLVMSPVEERVEVVVRRAGEGAGVGESITLRMRPAECVGDIKQNVRERMDIPVEQQRLSMNRTRLEDDAQTIAELQSQSITAPAVSVLLIVRIRITLHLYTTMVLSLEVPPNERIANLRTTILQQGHIPYHLQEITFNQQVLENGSRIDQYGVQDGSTLYVALRNYEVMVFLKTLTGRTIMLRVTPSDTVAQVKAKIEEQEDIPVDKQRLIFVGEQLNDFERLLDYRIEHESAVHLVIRTGNGFQVFVRLPSGRMLTFEVHPNEEFVGIKRKIQERHGLPMDLQQLFYNGQELRENGTYQEYNIQSNSIIELVHNHNRNTQIFVSLPSRETVTIWVNPEETIEVVKEIIEKKTRISVDLQELYFARQRLVNERTLQSYWIEENHMLHLDIVRPPVLHFTVRLQDDSLLELEEPANQTIEAVKREIQRRVRLAMSTQQLFLSGSELDDGKKLQDCEVHDGSVLDLITDDTTLTRSTTDVLLFVKTLTGKTLTLNVSPSDTILDLKTQIQEKEGIVVAQQCLVASGRQLDNSLKVSTCNIQNQSVIHLVLRLPSQGPIQLLVRTHNGHNFQLQGNLADTVEDLKARIEQENGVPQANQLLAFGDLELDEDDRSLGSYNLTDGATLQLNVAEN